MSCIMNDDMYCKLHDMSRALRTEIAGGLPRVIEMWGRPMQLSPDRGPPSLKDEAWIGWRSLSLIDELDWETNE